MNCFLKKVYVIVATLVLIVGAAYVASKEPSAPPHFRILSESGQQTISIFDAADGNCYVFLPSYADLKDVQVMIPSDRTVYLDEIRLRNQMTCDGFELERPYHYSVDGRNDQTLWFYQSRNVASLHIDTVSGKMTDIHSDKNHEEYASMSLYLPDGTLNHFDGSSRLKGRGNSTWDQDKRPYLLKLSSDADLLGMGSAKKWVLLANAYDETNLNNKLVFDLASRAGFDWSPDCRFVDLYLNGEYSGLYLLTEKIEVHPNRLNLDTASGDFLLNVETWERRESLLNHIESSMGRIIGICDSEPMPTEELDYVSYLVYLMEQELSGETDLRNSEILDLDSWVRRYLIDEISGNSDSDLTSSYFYYSDGTFYGGPIWDYDMVFGNSYRNQEPWSFVAKNPLRGEQYHAMYYDCLYNNASFYQRVTELYREEFAPVLRELIHHGMDDQLAAIEDASQMNSLRWKQMFDEWKRITEGRGIVRNPEDLKAYFIRRTQFLDSAWLDGKDYCTVQFESKPGRLFWNISVEKGTCLETTYMDLVNITWVDKQTGAVVDFGRAIEQDLIVTPQSAE